MTCNHTIIFFNHFWHRFCCNYPIEISFKEH
jgi:hypothetical protein